MTPQCVVKREDSGKTLKLCQRKVPCGEWPLTKGLEDKQALSALNVQLDRNSGLPKRGDPHGNGASIVLGGVTSYQGAWESQVQGEGRQALQRVKEKGVARCEGQTSSWDSFRKEARCGCIEPMAGKDTVRLESRVRSKVQAQLGKGRLEKDCLPETP